MQSCYSSREKETESRRQEGGRKLQVTMVQHLHYQYHLPVCCYFLLLLLLLAHLTSVVTASVCLFLFLSLSVLLHFSFVSSTTYTTTPTLLPLLHPRIHIFLHIPSDSRFLLASLCYSCPLRTPGSAGVCVWVCVCINRGLPYRIAIPFAIVCVHRILIWECYRIIKHKKIESYQLSQL